MPLITTLVQNRVSRGIQRAKNSNPKQGDVGQLPNPHENFHKGYRAHSHRGAYVVKQFFAGLTAVLGVVPFVLLLSKRYRAGIAHLFNLNKDREARRTAEDEKLTEGLKKVLGTDYTNCKLDQATQANIKISGKDLTLTKKYGYRAGLKTDNQFRVSLQDKARLKAGSNVNSPNTPKPDCDQLFKTADGSYVFYHKTNDCYIYLVAKTLANGKTPSESEIKASLAKSNQSLTQIFNGLETQADYINDIGNIYIQENNPSAIPNVKEALLGSFSSKEDYKLFKNITLGLCQDEEINILNAEADPIGAVPVKRDVEGASFNSNDNNAAPKPKVQTQISPFVSSNDSAALKLATQTLFSRDENGTYLHCPAGLTKISDLSYIKGEEGIEHIEFKIVQSEESAVLSDENINLAAVKLTINTAKELITITLPNQNPITVDFNWLVSGEEGAARQVTEIKGNICHAQQIELNNFATVQKTSSYQDNKWQADPDPEHFKNLSENNNKRREKYGLLQKNLELFPLMSFKDYYTKPTVRKESKQNGSYRIKINNKLHRLTGHLANYAMIDTTKSFDGAGGTYITSTQKIANSNLHSLRGDADGTIDPTTILAKCSHHDFITAGMVEIIPMKISQWEKQGNSAKPFKVNVMTTKGLPITDENSDKISEANFKKILYELINSATKYGIVLDDHKPANTLRHSQNGTPFRIDVGKRFATMDLVSDTKDYTVTSGYDNISTTPIPALIYALRQMLVIYVRDVLGDQSCTSYIQAKNSINKPNNNYLQKLLKITEEQPSSTKHMNDTLQQLKAIAKEDLAASLVENEKEAYRFYDQANSLVQQHKLANELNYHIETEEKDGEIQARFRSDEANDKALKHYQYYNVSFKALLAEEKTSADSQLFSNLANIAKALKFWSAVYHKGNKPAEKQKELNLFKIALLRYFGHLSLTNKQELINQIQLKLKELLPDYEMEDVLINK